MVVCLFVSSWQVCLMKVLKTKTVWLYNNGGSCVFVWLITHHIPGRCRHVPSFPPLFFCSCYIIMQSTILSYEQCHSNHPLRLFFDKTTKNASWDRRKFDLLLQHRLCRFHYPKPPIFSSIHLLGFCLYFILTIFFPDQLKVPNAFPPRWLCIFATGCTSACF